MSPRDVDSRLCENNARQLILICFLSSYKRTHSRCFQYCDIYRRGAVVRGNPGADIRKHPPPQRGVGFRETAALGNAEEAKDSPSGKPAL